VHLTDTKFVDLALHRAEADAAAHVERCQACKVELERWVRVVTELQELERAALDEAEVHRLSSLFTAYGPTRNQVGGWLATLLRSSAAPATAGVRGRSANELREYQAGPHVILVQLADNGRQGWTVHGQVLAGEAPLGGEGDLVITDAKGHGTTASIDSDGEFHCAGLPSGRYTATWWIGSTRIDEPELMLGDGV